MTPSPAIPAIPPLGDAPEAGAANGAEVLVLVAHPELEQSRVNRAMLDAVRAVAGGAGPARIQVHDLYALYPDYCIDVAAEQALLAAARLVVWQQPLHWYGMTPLLKLWVDDVLAFGWAYGPGGTALAGKDLWLAATTGGPDDSYRPDSYNRYFFDAFLPPYEQTAALCGMRFLPPLLLHGAHRADADAIAAHAAVFAERLERYPRWPEIEALDACVQCEVPGDVRPVEVEADADAGAAPRHDGAVSADARLAAA